MVLRRRFPSLLSRLRELLKEDPLVRDISWKQKAGYISCRRWNWIEFNDDVCPDVVRMLEIMARIGRGNSQPEHNYGGSAEYKLNEPFFDWLTTGSCGSAAPSVNQTTNILNIGQVSGSQIQQGTVGSVQTSLQSDERSDQVAEYDLSNDARELLIEASKDSNGKVYYSRTMHGQTIQTNGREFIEQGNPRSTARWEQAVNDLAAQGLIEDRWHQGEVFAVTGKGYKVADHLKG